MKIKKKCILEARKRMKDYNYVKWFCDDAMETQKMTKDELGLFMYNKIKNKEFNWGYIPSKEVEDFLMKCMVYCML